MAEATVVPFDDLDEGVDRYMRYGYRMEMICPADAPREILMSKGAEKVILRSKNRRRTSSANWATGRAGMEYRDLIPGRLGGKVIASHIRLPFGGEVPDSVHYHKVDFQMIYCVSGRIQVVYEDQGEPFWLETGDCVTQPPEIRHRVLYSEPGAEVIEVSSPAEHETWIEHDLQLPTTTLDRDRLFSGQRFIHSRADQADWIAISGEDVLVRETGVQQASNRLFNVRVFRRPSRLNSADRDWPDVPSEKGFVFPLDAGETLVVDFEV